MINATGTLSLGGTLLLGLVALSGCPSSETNPKVLWLAPVGRDETRLQLVDTEPRPF